VSGWEREGRPFYARPLVMSFLVISLASLESLVLGPASGSEKRWETDGKYMGRYESRQLLEMEISSKPRFDSRGHSGGIRTITM
jgi:hypothetical protein